MVFSRSHLPRLAFVNARIPRKLLRGPWTDDNVQFLRFVLWTTSMTVDWSNSEVYQAAMEGRKKAILEGNLEAVQIFNHNRRLGKFASTDTVRFAVIEGGCNRSIVYDTMVTAKMWRPKLSWQCAELDEWCDDRIACSDPKGSWLKALLVGLHDKERSEKASLKNDTGYEPYKRIKLDSAMGKYDGGAEDRLVINKVKWNQVSVWSIPTFHDTSTSTYLQLHVSIMDYISSTVNLLYATPGLFTNIGEGSAQFPKELSMKPLYA